MPHRKNKQELPNHQKNSIKYYQKQQKRNKKCQKNLPCSCLISQTSSSYYCHTSISTAIVHDKRPHDDDVDLGNPPALVLPQARPELSPLKLCHRYALGSMDQDNRSGQLNLMDIINYYQLRPLVHRWQVHKIISFSRLCSYHPAILQNIIGNIYPIFDVLNHVVQHSLHSTRHIFSQNIPRQKNITQLMMLRKK